MEFVQMSSLIYGYACPTCEIVTQLKSCSKHPELVMDLVLDNTYTPAKMSDIAPWMLMEPKNEGYVPVCIMPGSGESDGSAAFYIGTVLTACKEIPERALANGYIQTLQELPALVSDYLENPTDISKNKLMKQLALIQSRGRG
jgi:hypothetical protein